MQFQPIPEGSRMVWRASRRHCPKRPVLQRGVAKRSLELLVFTVIAAVVALCHCHCCRSSLSLSLLWLSVSGKTRTARYIPVWQMTGTRTGRYQAVPLRSIVDGRFPPSAVDLR
ncbi:hypothetical protein BHM03_00045358 [Ensete ventricosum]|nr:hypothetical protein BHM03_00045358 [Ensete ventricosum]